jgi:hypothetical protein
VTFLDKYDKREEIGKIDIDCEGKKGGWVVGGKEDDIQTWLERSVTVIVWHLR